MFKINNEKKNNRREIKKYDSERFNDKPKFKELVSIMFSQYIIIFPIVFGVMIIFMVFAKLLLFIWGV
ncbi:hypothetical protein R0131_15870 [Clostridium sp. AL.422]|uniref:hypothetical protein n=1 Tax=Clostridium TaxID=1485 RepID=UPI00293DA7A2|nr:MULTISPECIES: hypothetical protein [unclassified Clostridium]MDV4152303.1 hypothetical protein [Clostridium sp. AL.422]